MTVPRIAGRGDSTIRKPRLPGNTDSSRSVRYPPAEARSVQRQTAEVNLVEIGHLAARSQCKIGLVQMIAAKLAGEIGERVMYSQSLDSEVVDILVPVPGPDQQTVGIDVDG